MVADKKREQKRKTVLCGLCIMVVVGNHKVGLEEKPNETTNSNSCSEVGTRLKTRNRPKTRKLLVMV